MNTHQTFSKMSQELEHIKDSRSEFIENLLAAFERDHPDFIAHLKECGLDEEEYKNEYLHYYYKRLN